MHKAGAKPEQSEDDMRTEVMKLYGLPSEGYLERAAWVLTRIVGMHDVVVSLLNSRTTAELDKNPAVRPKFFLKD